MLRVLRAGSLPQAFPGLKWVRRKVRRPDLRFVVMDLSVPNTDHMQPMVDDDAAVKTKATQQFDVLTRNSRETGFALMSNRFPMEK
jgi:homoaconitase/3-isopropylmalate dehydratase large subunit